MTKQKYILLILILGGLTALGPFSIDMYLPGFSSIAKDLHTDVPSVALSLSSFFIGISLGQLIYGPLLDRFGRKKPLYAGLALYIVASLGCLFVTNIEELILLRFVQAIGSCAAGVTSMTLVRDLFPVKDNAKVFALLMLVLGVSPMLAPTVGGYVITEFGWQLVFVILAAIAVCLLFAAIIGLKDSYEPDHSLSLNPVAIAKNYLAVFREPQFFTYALTGALCFSGLFAYVSASPLVFMDVYKVSGEVYGWIFAFLSIGFIGASQVNTVLLRHYSSQQIIKVSLAAQLVTALLFLALTILDVLGLYGTIGFLFIYLGCLGLINPNTAALSLAPFSKNAGSASSLLGAMQMCVGTIASVVISMFKTESAIPMVGLMAAAALLSQANLFRAKKPAAEVEQEELAVVEHI